MPPERILSILGARKIEGIVFGPDIDLKLFEGHNLSTFAMAGFNYSDLDYPVHRASVHHSQDMERAFTELLQLNFKRIAFIIDEATDTINRQRWTGRFLSIAGKAGHYRILSQEGGTVNIP
jgi:DNA-binding LacI/PurR family transcriptional regulator